MLTIDCPLCAGTASMDETWTVLECDGCGVAVDVAADPVSAQAAAA